MFQKIMEFLRGVFKKMVNQKSISTALNVVPIVSTPMAEAIEDWSQMYKGESPWLTADIKSLNLASAIAREVATLTALELKSEVTGSARAVYLNEQYTKVKDKLRTQLEYACAGGGLVMKPYVADDGLAVDYVQADSFFPVAYDSNGNITSGIFVDQKTIGQKVYTKLEYHTFNKSTHTVQNKAYVSDNGSDLGREITLDKIPEWAGLVPEANVEPVEKPLFAYLKMPFANTIDPYSPIGVSIYSRAVGLIEEADKQYSRYLWEFESGERALYVDVTAFKKDTAGNAILPDKRLYKTMDMVEGFYEDWTPTLRQQELADGLDKILKKIEFNCGLAYGTISDPNVTDKTATEIKMAKQRSYATVSDIQRATEAALNDLLYAMDVYATLYNLAPQGTYELNAEWSDSIIADTDTEFARIERMIALGAAQPWELRVFQYGEDEETAKSRVAPVMDFGAVV